MTTRPATPSVPAVHDHGLTDATRPVGWYRDPEHPREHRYWTGERWVENPSMTFPPEPRDPAA